MKKKIGIVIFATMMATLVVVKTKTRQVLMKQVL